MVHRSMYGASGVRVGYLTISHSTPEKFNVQMAPKSEYFDCNRRLFLLTRIRLGAATPKSSPGAKADDEVFIKNRRVRHILNSIMFPPLTLLRNSFLFY